jgi:class 3 adenylate cyclase/tetratricopeptide (TPR) repeat protein
VHRKVVTVLFCDVVGSTELGEAIDPEALQDLLSRYFERMKAIVEAHGASVEKFIGDAVMAVFGVPRVHEDDALRAVSAAAEMRAALPVLGIEGRIGLETGEVVTGTEERLATGDVVNVAARLQQAAGPGEILLGAATLSLVAPSVVVEQVGPLALKGKARPVEAYRLVARHELRPPAHYGRFVGRAAELDRLGAVWDTVLAESRCELVTVVGEAGIGKSRLVEEFLARTDVRAVAGRCLPYGDGITYSPVVEVVKQLGVPSDLGAAAALRSLIRETESGTTAEEIARGFRRLVEEHVPLVVVFDDLHWGEDTFLDLVDDLDLLSRKAPYLVLCLARPELLDRRPAWRSTLELGPLDEAAVEELMGVEREEGLRRRVARAAGGNPLFVTEMLAFIDSASDAEAAPPTLQALLAARIDELPEPERRVLEAAAVEGEIFHRGSVQALLDDPPHLTRVLAGLARRQLIQPSAAAIQDQDAFRFRHLLIRDAAYDALAKAARADLHAGFADWLEEHRDGVVELDELLGHHLEQAACYREELGRPDERVASRAAAHLATAGRTAMNRADAHAVARLLDRALTLTRPLGVDVALELDLAEAQPTMRERIAVAKAAAARAAAAGDQAAADIARAFSAQLAGATDHDATERQAALVRAAIPVMEGRGDHAALVHVWQVLGSVAHVRGRWEDVARAGEAAIRHARLAGYPRGRVFYLAIALVYGPRPADEALATLEALAPQTGGIGEETWRVVLLAMLGRLDEAIQLADEVAAQRYELLGGPWGALLQAECADLAGDHAVAASALRTFCDALERDGQQSHLSTYLPQLGLHLLALSRVDEAESLARRGRQLADENDYSSAMLWRRVQALVDSHRGETTRAERLAREAVAIGDRTDALNEQAAAYADLATVLEAAGRVDEATTALEESVARYERKRNVAMLAQVRPRLSALRTARI